MDHNDLDSAARLSPTGSQLVVIQDQLRQPVLLQSFCQGLGHWRIAIAEDSAAANALLQMMDGLGSSLPLDVLIMYIYISLYIIITIVFSLTKNGDGASTTVCIPRFML